MKRYIISALPALMLFSQSFASDFYVSATATGSGDGSFHNPWKLQQALSAPAAIANPTDTVWIWVRGGLYTNKFDPQTSFSCFTKGTTNAPVIFRNYKNERATIDGQLTHTLACTLGNCTHSWFWGLEVFNSDTADRDHPVTDRSGGVYCTASNIKFINMIVHDMGSGLDLWKTASNSEAYGCVIYNIGNNQHNGTNWEGHGHGMYLQNDTIGIKNIHNNIIFSTFGYGMKVWQTTTTDAIGNFNIQRNIVFNGGAPSENLGGAGNNYRTHNFFVVSNSVNNPIRNTVIKHNYTFAGTNTPRPPVNAFGLNYGVDNLTLDSNYLTCQTRLGFNNTPVFNASVNGNKIIAGIPAAYGYYLWGFTNSDFPNNTYISQQPDFGVEYFVLPNKYEPGRSHLVIYNWGSGDSVQINLMNTGLQIDDTYELINVMDYYHNAIIDTIDASGIIKVPMLNQSVAPVVGSAKRPVSQFPVFGAFVLRKVENKITTGVSYLTNHTSISIFPNPTSGDMNACFSIPCSGVYQIFITDISGKNPLIQYSEYLLEGRQEIQIITKDLKKGAYWVQIHGPQSVLSGKFILN